MSHEGQIYFAENFYKFKEYFVSFLQKFDSKDKKITYADVLEFEKGLKNLRSKPPSNLH